MQDPAPGPDILDFKIKDLAEQAVVIDQSKATVSITVPFGTILTDRLPEITLSQSGDIVPSPVALQDFTKTVLYTVSAKGTGKRVYTVITTTAAARLPEIRSVNSSKIQAGDTLTLVGKYFGNSPLSLSTYLKNTQKATETKVNFRLLNDSTLTLYVPKSLEPALYQIVLSKNGSKMTGNEQLDIRIPTPVISSIKKKNVLQGDTLSIAGEYIVENAYQYRIDLVSKEQSIPLQVSQSARGLLQAVVSSSSQPGRYGVVVRNLTEKTASQAFADSIRVYGLDQPHILKINGLKDNNKASDLLEFKVRNFGKETMRFYSLLFSNGSTLYSANGIYSSGNQTVSVQIPETIQPGNYTLQMTILNAAGSAVFEIELDELLTILN